MDWYSWKIKSLNINLKLNYTIKPEQLTEYNEIILATGVIPRIPEIPGVHLENVITYQDVILGKFDPRLSNFAIMGTGGIGIDVAEFLSYEGKSPTESLFDWKQKWGVSDPAQDRGGLSQLGPQPKPSKRNVFLMQRSKSKPGKKLGKTTGWIHLSSLRMNGIKIYTDVSYKEINKSGILVCMGDGETNQFDADKIVLCVGQEPNRELTEELHENTVSFHLIGGAKKTEGLDAKIAIDQGTRLGARI